MDKTELELNGRLFKIETGSLARQANGAVLVQYGDTVILVTVCRGMLLTEKTDFLPLTINYRERTYAAGKIPGGFFKREGRPREREILVSRLTDRAIRPLLPANINYEIQVMITVLSTDRENDTVIPSLIGTSLALGMSDIPFLDVLGAVTIGRVRDEFIVNPTFAQLEMSDLDLTVAGTETGIFMIEGNAREISEEIITEALKLAQKEIMRIIQIEKQFLPQNQPKITVPTSEIEKSVYAEINTFSVTQVRDALRVPQKKERDVKLDEVKKLVKEKFNQYDEKIINEVLEKIICEQVRRLILDEGIRCDGRKPDEVRPINCQVGVLPRTHGSALFTRGQTQALVTVTLGSPEDMQVMDELIGEYKDRFLVHYNFPPFSTGEVRPDRAPSRREIGHGMLTKRALQVVFPAEEVFPYTIRIVSDILESNGSSSMASVCGGSLALLDSGVPISAPVSGIAMGLVAEGEKCVILTDILGIEDRVGDLDLKIAGTRKGITACQMDVKNQQGINPEVIHEILLQSRKARLFVLDKMEEVIKEPRTEISIYAPRMLQLQIPTEKIGELIGPGGKTIRKIHEETGAEIDIHDDGRVSVTAPDNESLELTRQMIEYYTADAEVGKVYKGKVSRIAKFGAFVEILPGKEGLVHISQLDESRVERVEDIVSEGDEIMVKVIDIDSEGRISLSRKQVMYELRRKKMT